MGNDALIGKIDNTVITMYKKHYESGNANLAIYNALLYEFIMLRILAAEMDKDGVYSDIIEDILQRSIEEEKKSANVFSLICNVRCAVFEMLEVLAFLANMSGEYQEKINNIHAIFEENLGRAANINQQVYWAADASCTMLSVIVEMLDKEGAYLEIMDSILQDYQARVERSNGVFQRAYCSDRAFFELLTIILALLGGQGGITLGETIQNKLNEAYQRAKGIFHDITFVSQASVEALAFCILAYAGEELSNYTLPNWSAIALAEVQGAMNGGDEEQQNAPVSAPVETPKTSSPTSNTSSGGCYVATCVYGSYNCPEVWTLRRYRDDTLGATWYGRAFIRTYYAVSPTLVKWFGKTKWFKKLWQGKLDRMVKRLQEKGVESTPYQDKNW